MDSIFDISYAHSVGFDIAFALFGRRPRKCPQSLGLCTIFALVLDAAHKAFVLSYIFYRRDTETKRV